MSTPVWQLSWDDVDPSRHPFDPAGMPGFVRSLPEAADVPVSGFRQTWDPERQRSWRGKEADPWLEAVTQKLEHRYGPWVTGWSFSNHDGGVVGSWCCPWHSFSEDRRPVEDLISSLLEWRGWLEHLADRFERLLPLPEDPEDLEYRLERAAMWLITSVVDRTTCDDAWYAHCGTVLVWFLEAAGVPAEQREALIDSTVRGRFHSHRTPEDQVIRETAEELAAWLRDDLGHDPDWPARG